MVALVHNEQRLVGEFIAHHIGLGIDRIHLFDSRSTDLTRRVIERAADAYSGVSVETWDRTHDDALRRALEMFQDDVDWLLAVTCDEFLVSPDGANLIDFLERMDDIAAIGIHRAAFGSSGLFVSPDDLITASLVRRAPDMYGPNQHVKSLVRPHRMRGVHNAHLFISDGAAYFNSRSEELHWIHPGLTANSPVLSPFRLNHYFGRYPTDVPVSRNVVTDVDWNAGEFNNTLDRSALRYVPRTRDIMARIGLAPDGRETVRPKKGISRGVLNVFRWTNANAQALDQSESDVHLTSQEQLISEFDICLNMVAGGPPMIGDSLCILPLALELANTFRKRVKMTGNFSGVIKPLVHGLPISFDDAIAPGRIQINAVLSDANEFARSNDIHITQAFFVLAKMAPPPLPITVPLHTESCGLPPGIVVCPFTTADPDHVKRWYAERWMAVIDGLASAGKARVVYLVGGDGEAFHLYDHPLVQPINGRPLPVVLDLMRNSPLVMTVDTALSHLAHFGKVSRHLLLYPKVNPPSLGTNPRGKFIHGWPIEILPETVISEALKMIEQSVIA